MTHESVHRFATLAIAVVFTVYAAMVMSDLMSAYRETAPYFIGDWQINYVAGYVRRGLLGEFARFLLVDFGIDTKTTILVMQAFFYVVFFVASTMLLAPLVIRHPLAAFAVFCPMTIAFKALDSGGGTSGLNTTGAKDIVFLALLAVQALLSTRARGDLTASDGRLLLLSLVWAAVVLVHEGFFFFLPFSVAILLLTARTRIGPLKLGLIALPAVCAFAVSVAFHGDAAAAGAICASLGSGAPEGCEKTGAIAWLARPASTYVMLTYYVIVLPPYILLTSAQAAMLGGVGLALTALDREVAKWTLEALEHRANRLLIIACFVVPIPVFAASDHGRFLHIWFTSALFVIAAFVLCRRGVGMPTAIAARVPKGSSFIPRALWLALFVAYVTTWSAKGPCCPERLNFGFAGRVFLSIAARL